MSSLAQASWPLRSIRHHTVGTLGGMRLQIFCCEISDLLLSEEFFIGASSGRQGSRRLSSRGNGRRLGPAPRQCCILAQQIQELAERRIVVAGVPAGEARQRQSTALLGNLAIDDTGMDHAGVRRIEQRDGAAERHQADDGVAVGTGLDDDRQDARCVEAGDQCILQLRSGIAAREQDALAAKVVPGHDRLPGQTMGLRDGQQDGLVPQWENLMGTAVRPAGKEDDIERTVVEALHQAVAGLVGDADLDIGKSLHVSEQSRPSSVSTVSMTFVVSDLLKPRLRRKSTRSSSVRATICARAALMPLTKRMGEESAKRFSAGAASWAKREAAYFEWRIVISSKSSTPSGRGEASQWDHLYPSHGTGLDSFPSSGSYACNTIQSLLQPSGMMGHVAVPTEHDTLPRAGCLDRGPQSGSLHVTHFPGVMHL